MSLPEFSWGSESVSFPYGFIVTASKEFIRNEAGIALAEKHTITIKGSIPTGSLIGSIGAAVSALNGGAGTSQIAPLSVSGGVSYGAARLVSASTAEPPEDTAGIQYIEVTLTFESYSGSGGAPLRSSSETIEVRRDDDKLSNSNPDEAYFGFTVTHTVSAQGIAGASNNGFGGAQAWVTSRISGSSNITSTTDGGYGTGGSFSVSSVPGVGSVEDCTITRSTSVDMAAASYSVTTTYFKSKYKYFIEMTASVQRDDNGEMSASAQGTVQGYATGGVNATQSDAYTNATAGWAALGGFTGQIYTAAADIFAKAGDKPGIGALHNYPISYSLGKNPARGSYTFNVTYKAYTTVIEGLRGAIAGENTLTASLTVTDDNKDGEIQIFASIPIIGRKAGPILQDMGTTNSRRRSVTVEGTVKPAARTAYNASLIDTCYGICKQYSPGGYMTSKSGSWDANTGRVSATIEWTYE